VVSGLPHSFYTWQREVRIGESASATAFWVLIAFGPAGLVAINVLGLFIDQGSIATHLIAIADAAPGSFGDLLVTQFTLIASPSPGSIAVDAILVVTSLWTISTAVAMLMRGLRRGYGMPIAPFLLVRAIASLAGLVSIIALGLLAFSIDMASTTQQVIGITCASILAFALILGLHALAVGRAFPLAKPVAGSRVFRHCPGTHSTPVGASRILLTKCVPSIRRNRRARHVDDRRVARSLFNPHRRIRQPNGPTAAWI
jgi:hypothetical protein